MRRRRRRRSGRRALAAGGADAFLQFGASNQIEEIYTAPTARHPDLTPNNILRYARQLQRGIGGANQRLTTLAAMSPGSRTASEPSEDLDDRTVGGKLAGLIRCFRAVQWRNDHAAKLALLMTILRKTHDHLQRRHDPNHLGAVRLILGAVEELTALAGEPRDRRRY